MKKVTALIFFLIFYLSNMALAGDYFRCGKNLVSVGDTIGQVLMTCGEPSVRETVSFETEGNYRGNAWYRGRGRYAVRGTYSETSEPVEIWYYNCGKGKFIQILTFRGGVLVNVENGDRGSGKPDWERAR